LRDHSRRCETITSVATPWLKRVGWSGWRSEVGWLALVLGMFGQCISCAVAVPGLPYQDPTPELLAKQAEEIRTGQALALVGTVLSISLVIVGLSLIVAARRRNRPAAGAY
jgi:uncharacterized membrane protein